MAFETASMIGAGAGLLGSLAGSAISFGSGAIGAYSARRAADQQHRDALFMQARELEEAHNLRVWQKMMSDTAHRREVADLRAAGLNPILSATGGNGASTPAGAMANFSGSSSIFNNSAQGQYKGAELLSAAMTAAGESLNRMPAQLKELAGAYREMKEAGIVDPMAEARIKNLSANTAKAVEETKYIPTKILENSIDVMTNFSNYKNPLKVLNALLQGKESSKAVDKQVREKFKETIDKFAPSSAKQQEKKSEIKKAVKKIMFTPAPKKHKYSPATEIHRTMQMYNYPR